MHKPIPYYNQLLDKYLAGNISTEAANELFDFIEEYPDEARDLLTKSGATDFPDKFKQPEDLDPVAGKRIFDRLSKSIGAEAATHKPFARVIRKNWLPYAAAAAVILVTATVAVLLLRNDQSTGALADNDKQQLQQDFAPGGNKAFLTLADGSRIVLDEVQNGNLTQQGNARIVKLDNSRLSYEAAGSTNNTPTFNTLQVPRGGQYSLTLSDGTRVWLNAASSIKYPTVFTGKERNVQVTGEVYLEIAKNTAMPFAVSANHTKILVLGTSFNVNAYPDETSVKTTLITGSAKVIKSSTTEAAVLSPGQQAEIADHFDGVKVGTVDTDQILAWKNGLFSFNNADIKTIMRQLARWYDINIVYEGGVPQQRFFGDMNRNLSLSQVLKGLEVSKVNFRMEGRNLIVMP